MRLNAAGRCVFVHRTALEREPLARGAVAPAHLACEHVHLVYAVQGAERVVGFGDHALRTEERDADGVDVECGSVALLFLAGLLTSRRQAFPIAGFPDDRAQNPVPRGGVGDDLAALFEPCHLLIARSHDAELASIGFAPRQRLTDRGRSTGLVQRMHEIEVRAVERMRLVRQQSERIPRAIRQMQFPGGWVPDPGREPGRRQGRQRRVLVGRPFAVARAGRQHLRPDADHFTFEAAQRGARQLGRGSHIGLLGQPEPVVIRDERSAVANGHREGVKTRGGLRPGSTERRAQQGRM